MYFQVDIEASKNLHHDFSKAVHSAENVSNVLDDNDDDNENDVVPLIPDNSSNNEMMNRSLI